jgi:hypothetical protein
MDKKAIAEYLILLGFILIEIIIFPVRVLFGSLKYFD